MQPKPGLDRRQIHQVRQALQHHLHTTEDSDAVVFIGRKIVAVPGELIFDKTLSGDEVRHWCALRTICNEGEINRLPDHNSLAEHFGKSHQTLHAHVARHPLAQCDRRHPPQQPADTVLLCHP